MEVLQVEQGSDEWFRARMGIPTASEFKTVLAKGRGKAPSKTRLTYIYKLAGERITGEPMENYSNAYMERGHSLEDEVRRTYAFMQSCDPTPIGFVRNGNTGCSPDSFVGDDGMLEIKTHAPHILIPMIIADQFPPEHVAQCQGQLWVAEREWIDLACYYPGMPLFVKRAARDETYIANLAEEVGFFIEDLERVVERISKYGGGA